MDSYSKYLRLVTDIVADQVPLFEKSSIDEFYIDLSGMEKFFGCSASGRSDEAIRLEKQSLVHNPIRPITCLPLALNMYYANRLAFLRLQGFVFTLLFNQPNNETLRCNS